MAKIGEKDARIRPQKVAEAEPKKPAFDRRAYMREYMRVRRAAKKKDPTP